MRLILSRKGFDSAHGGIPSPILPDGRLCPLPIPDDRSPFRYDALSVAGEPVGQLLADLRPERLPPVEFAHLDPDLDRNSLARPAGWRPMFGQVGAAQSHLRNQGVDLGDLFLFFGWFREVEVVDGRFQYVPKCPDRHVIFGWLQVSEMWPVNGDSGVPDWVKTHVHFRRKGKRAANEMVYSAGKRLSLSGSSTSLPGGGLMPQYRPELCLTAAGQSRTIWRLPDWFWPDKGKRPLSYHGRDGRWERDSQGVLLRSAPRGQEFVLQGADYPEMIDWVSALLTGVIHS